jgi:hypothetical protein
MALNSINSVFSYWLKAKYEAPEVVTCGVLLLLAAASAAIVAARERRVDI